MKLTVKVDTSELKELKPALVSITLQGVNKSSIAMTSYIQRTRLRGGTSDNKLGVRSGNLRSKTRVIPAKIVGREIVGGTLFDTPYAGVHVGPRGQKTTIRPKRAKNLAIPLDAARTKGGAGKRLGPRSFPDLKLIPKASGNHLLAKVLPGGGIIPFFVLVKSVTIKARVHPEDIQREFSDDIIIIIERDIQREAARI